MVFTSSMEFRAKIKDLCCKGDLPWSILIYIVVIKFEDPNDSSKKILKPFDDGDRLVITSHLLFIMNTIFILTQFILKLTTNKL